MKQNLLYTTLGLLFCVGLAPAQESINTSGGDATGNGGKVAYSIGQTFYTANSSDAGTISQGVQQSIEVYTLGSIEEPLTLSTKVYPNPSSDVLVLAFGDPKSLGSNYALYDVTGKLLFEGSAQQLETRISLTNVPSGPYILKLSQNGKTLQSFKIIKN